MNNSTKILLVLAAAWMATTIQAQTPRTESITQEKNYRIPPIMTDNYLR